MSFRNRLGKCYIQEEWVSLDTMHAEAGEGVSWKQTFDAVPLTPKLCSVSSPTLEEEHFKDKEKKPEAVLAADRPQASQASNPGCLWCFWK